MAYAVKIQADSISEADVRLTTMEVTFPRIVLAEFNTHRTFSRNSASSRAIPIKEQIKRVEQDPFVPEYWGRNQSGMQAEQELTGEEREEAIIQWLVARDEAVANVWELSDLNVHKQLANRLLEPFMWQTVIVTATEWNNFFALRANEDAQPEIRTIAEMMLEAYSRSEPALVKEGEWHLPLIQPSERNGSFEFSKEARQISAARCARVSYLTHDGKLDVAADFKLYKRLVSGGHMSPLEHVATPFSYDESAARNYLMPIFKEQVGKSAITPEVSDMLNAIQQSLEFKGNLRGWTQLRKLIPNEHDFGLVGKS